MKKYIIIGIVSFLLSLLLLLVPGICSAANREELPETITMSREQFNELQTIIKEQGQRSTEFETNLQLLEQSSREQIATLSALRVSHDKMQKRLEAAEKYSNEARLLIDEQNSFLQTLSEQIKKEQKKSKLKQIQKLGWGFIGGVLVGAIAASR